MFLPSYKKIIDSHDYTYKRTPSWTDRIIYKKIDIEDFKVHSYAIDNETNYSDHKFFN